MIPKPDGSERSLGISTVKDRIVHMATKIAIEPVFEADFNGLIIDGRLKLLHSYNYTSGESRDIMDYVAEEVDQNTGQ
jgi:hypothetical protein